MLTIYGGTTPNAAKVVMTAIEAGLEFNYVQLDLLAGDQKSPEHLQRHPLGKVPAIEHDGRPLFESNVIARYLARIGNNNLYPEGVFEQAQHDQWIDMMAQHVGRWLVVFFFEEFIKPNFFNQDPNQASIDEARGFLDQQLPALDAHLSTQAYISDDQFRVADILAFIYFQTHEKSSVSIESYPNIVNWYNGIRQRPSVQATMEYVNPESN